MHILTTISRTLFVLISFSLMAYVDNALAHHPHDPIDALAISPSYNEDNTVFIANTDHLLKSVDGGRSWKELINGLDNIYPISSIDIVPSEIGTHTLFISTLGNGVYRSTNGGNSWENVSSGLQNLVIREISARTNDTVLAYDATGRLFITNDGGELWRSVATMPKDALITSMSPPMHFPETKILAGDSIGRILVSTDSGVSWESIGQLPTKSEITVIAIDPSDTSSTTFFIGTKDKGLYKSSDNGTTFQPLDNGLPAHHIMSLALSPKFTQDHTMIATNWREAAFISSDGGDTWVQFNKGLTTDEQADTVKYLSPHFRQVKITSHDSQTMFIAAFTGLFKSANGGHSWTELETRPVKLIKGLAVSPNQHSTFNVAITTYGGGAYISHDHGKTWVIGNKGLKTTRLSDIKFAPTSSNNFSLFSASQGYLLKSMDSGTSWDAIHLSNNPLRKKIIRKLIAWGLPKSVGQRFLKRTDSLLVYPTVIAPSPNYASDKTILFGTRYHGMFRSEDGGQTSYNTWNDTKNAVTFLAVSPSFPIDHTAFIYIRGDGIYKSTDRGDSWRKIIKGLPFDTNKDSDVKKKIADNDFAVVFSPGYNKDKTLFAAGPLGLFKSTDQGESWSELKNDTLGPTPNILAVSLSPNYVNDHTLLISLKSHGLYKSLDGGQNFFEAGGTSIKNNYSITLIAFSSGYSQNNTIYAASDEALFLSTDRSDSWTLIQRPVRYEDIRDVMRYEGSWMQTENTEYSASTIHYSVTPGDKAELDFVGCGIRWVASKAPQGGIVNVYIDDSFIESVDLYSAQQEPMSEVFTKSDLSCKPHTITIELSKKKDGHPFGKRVILDAFDVLPPD